MARIGDTIKLTATFSNWEGELTSPANVVLRIFDKHKRQVGEDITVLPYDAGLYEYDYVVPSNLPSPIYFEYSGTLEGKPAVGRGEIATEWIQKI